MEGGADEMSTELTAIELNGLQLLHRLLVTTTTLNQNEKQTLASFIKHCISNIELNTYILHNRDEIMKKNNIHIDVIYFVLHLTFRTRCLNNLIKRNKLATLTTIFEKLNNQEKLGDDERFMPSEFGAMMDLANLLALFLILEQKKIIGLNPELEAFHQQIKHCHRLNEMLERSHHKKGMQLFDKESLSNFFVTLRDVLLVISDENEIKPKP